MLADIVDHVIGIDPDRDQGTASLVEASTGGELATAAFETTRGGYERLVAWADRHTSPESRAWAVEGSGSYGSGACAHLSAAGEQVIEFSHPRTAATSDGAKTDALDARRAAREVLGRPGSGRSTRPGPPRGAASAGIHPPRRPDGAHRGDQRTQSPHHQRARRLARPTPRPHHRRPGRQMRRVPPAGGAPRRAHSHQTGHAQPRAADQDPHRRGRRPANEHPRARRSRRPPPAQPARRPGPPPPRRSTSPGHTPAAAATKQHSPASPASPHSKRPPGQNTRHRLNRRGDRQLNRALHTIAVTPSRYCPHTQAYIAKRTAEGKTPREAQRCLKRYIARQIYRLLEHPPTSICKT